MPDALVVNIFGGPGSGKSVTAAKVFADLKLFGHNTELVPEFAKDLTWEKRMNALAFQPYVFAKQLWRVHRLLGEVDAVVTDSPVLLSLVYGGQGDTLAFRAYVLDTFRQMNTLNIMLMRHDIRDTYDERGRNQTLDEAEQIDKDIENTLRIWNIPYHSFFTGENDYDMLLNLIRANLCQPA